MREHRQRHTLQDMLSALRPDYMVLRQRDLLDRSGGNGAMFKDYDVIREFRVPEAQVSRCCSRQ